MKIKTLLITLLFAVSMWAQNAAPTLAQTPDNQTKATCCKDGAACCKSGAACCQGKDAASCCKKGAACCKKDAACCGHETIAKADCCKAGAACCNGGGAHCCAAVAKDTTAKNCCGGNMCKRHGGDKA